jgi:hypothetical protein
MHSHRSKSVEYTNAMRTYTDNKDETGTEVKGEKGDVFLFSKGSRIIFRTDGYALAFFCGVGGGRRIHCRIEGERRNVSSKFIAQSLLNEVCCTRCVHIGPSLYDAMS